MTSSNMPNAPRGTIGPIPEGFTPNASGNWRPQSQPAPGPLAYMASAIPIPQELPKAQPQRSMRQSALTLALLAGLASSAGQ